MEDIQLLKQISHPMYKEILHTKTKKPLEGENHQMLNNVQLNISITETTHKSIQNKCFIIV